MSSGVDSMMGGEVGSRVGGVMGSEVSSGVGSGSSEILEDLNRFRISASQPRNPIGRLTARGLVGWAGPMWIELGSMWMRIPK